MILFLYWSEGDRPRGVVSKGTQVTMESPSFAFFTCQHRSTAAVFLWSKRRALCYVKYGIWPLTKHPFPGGPPSLLGQMVLLILTD